MNYPGSKDAVSNYIRSNGNCLHLSKEDLWKELKMEINNHLSLWTGKCWKPVVCFCCITKLGLCYKGPCDLNFFQSFHHLWDSGPFHWHGDNLKRKYPFLLLLNRGLSGHVPQDKLQGMGERCYYRITIFLTTPFRLCKTKVRWYIILSCTLNANNQMMFKIFSLLTLAF